MVLVPVLVFVHGTAVAATAANLSTVLLLPVSWTNKTTVVLRSVVELYCSIRYIGGR